MQRVIVHAGFHKTGTSSVQKTLEHNRQALSPHVTILLRDDFKSLTDHSRLYARTPTEDRLRVIRRKARKLIERRPQNLPLILSAEELTGPLPGRHGTAFYDAAPALLGAIRSGLRDALPEADVVIYLSTRNREAWLRSVWWQNLRATRLTEDQDQFCDRMRPVVQFDALLERISERVGALNVTSLPLEKMTALPHGPLTPLLDLAEIPGNVQARLSPPVRANQAPNDEMLYQAFLSLNRSELSDEVVSERKIQLRRAN